MQYPDFAEIVVDAKNLQFCQCNYRGILIAVWLVIVQPNAVYIC